jgi:hypothetical protein
MQATRHRISREFPGFFLVSLAVATVAVATHKTPATADEQKMDRAQTIIVNLNKMQGCAGWFLLQDIKQAKLMDHDLTRAHRQIEEADHTYAKLRGRPDDKFLTPVMVKLEKAEQERARLEEDLHETFDQLRTSIQDVIVQDEPKAKKKTK